MSNGKLPKAPKTMEVPKVLNVHIVDGILDTTDARGSVEQLLFRHLHESMNDKNAMQALQGLANAHGFSVEVADEG